MKLLHVRIESNMKIANQREKLLLVGHEAEVLLYFSFSEAEDVANYFLFFF